MMLALPSVAAAALAAAEAPVAAGVLVAANVLVAAETHPPVSRTPHAATASTDMTRFRTLASIIGHSPWVAPLSWQRRYGREQASGSRLPPIFRMGGSTRPLRGQDLAVARCQRRIGLPSGNALPPVATEAEPKKRYTPTAANASTT